MPARYKIPLLPCFADRFKQAPKADCSHLILLNFPEKMTYHEIKLFSSYY